MYFLVYTEDKPDSLDIRKANREAHIAWLRSDGPVTLHTAGPWLDDDGIMRGSVLLVEADSHDTVMTWLDNDPYKAAGLPGRVMVRHFNWAIGAPIA